MSIRAAGPWAARPQAEGVRVSRGWAWRLLSLAVLLPVAAVVASCQSGAATIAAGGSSPATLTRIAGSTWKTGFVRRDGTRLVLDGHTFRYGGANIYWLGLDQNVGGIAYPTRFRIDDALETAKDMGATVVRAQTLGISTGNPLSLEPSLGRFNPRAFGPIDYSIYRAGQLGLRLNIPLTDYWDYYLGSIYSFTTWLGQRPCGSSTAACPALARYFYTSRAAIAAFEQYISHLLNHVNAYTGIPYKDDPTIMSWELGSELSGMPESWVNTIAAFIHHLAPRQLIAAGQQLGVSTAAIDSPAIDLVDVHYYPPSVAAVEADAGTVTRAGKVYIADEYGSTYASPVLFRAMVGDREISGASFWSLFAHKDTYGYVQHADGYTLHYPGDTPAMMADGDDIRQFDISMTRGRWGPVPPPPPPGQPLITSVTQVRGHAVIAWRGTTDAGAYTVQQAASAPGTWTTICDKCATDNDTPWSDPAPAPASPVWYRVIPYTLQGRPGPPSPAYRSG
jgi:mannan endo-1,4-beta-mannosidase